MTPESIALWQERVLPLLDALREHTTVDQLSKLLYEAARDQETSPSVLEIVNMLPRLREEIDKL